MAQPPPPPPSIYSSAAIDHLSIGYERLAQLRAFLLTSSPVKPSATAPAIGLLDKALQCVSAALSELQATSPRCIGGAAVEDSKNEADLRKRRKKRIQSWTIVTSVPHFDGHQWRKYGQKHIHRSKFPRSYYKCTYSKDQGCLSTKTIQQKEDEDSNPPKYEVRYSMQHTCKAMETTQAIPFVMDSSAMITSTSTSSTCSSQELSASPRPLPLQVADINDYSFSAEVGLMESMLLATEPEGEANGAESSSLRPPLAAFDFDWDWLMS